MAIALSDPPPKISTKALTLWNMVYTRNVLRVSLQNEVLCLLDTDRKVHGDVLWLYGHHIHPGTMAIITHRWINCLAFFAAVLLLIGVCVGLTGSRDEVWQEYKACQSAIGCHTYRDLTAHHITSKWGPCTSSVMHLTL